jgi:hypothetical protein
LHDVLQNEDVMMVSVSKRTGGATDSALRCRQVVAVESGGQCFRIVVLYDWGATTSMVTREAVNTLGLTSTKEAKKIIRGLGGVTTLAKSTCAIPLVARNGDLRVVTAWEVENIATLPDGQPPEAVDEQFPGLRYLSESSCLVQSGGPVHLLIGMDHGHLMLEHAAEGTRFSSRLRLMKYMFGNQYILVGEGALRLSLCDAMEVDKRNEAANRLRRRREECRRLAQEARQKALKHTHKLPRKLWDDKNEAKKVKHPTKVQPQGVGTCGPSCKERKKL